MKKGIPLLSLLACFFGGCATPPESIAPAYVSDIGYMNLTCDQMAAEQSRLVAALSQASDAQRKARSGDTVGVIFLGLPTASLSGSNQASYIARLKGELEALQRAAIRKDCGLQLVSIMEASEKADEDDEEEEGSTVRDLAKDPRRNQSRY